DVYKLQLLFPAAGLFSLTARLAKRMSGIIVTPLSGKCLRQDKKREFCFANCPGCINLRSG
ncbi:hypothetical protein CWN24_15535, partial [Klebsiella pneumoniae]